MRDSYRRSFVEQGSAVYYMLVWLTVFLVVGFAIATWCKMSPDQNMEYAKQCLAAHGSYSIQDTADGTNRSCIVH